MCFPMEFNWAPPPVFGLPPWPWRFKSRFVDQRSA